MTENTTASGAADRVNAYLDRRATMRSIDPEVVHGIDGPDFELTVSDLRALAASAPVAPTQPVHLDLDRVLSIADVHAEESREDGVRLMDRGGLNAFASDIIRVSQGQPEASSQPAPMPYPTDAQIDAVYEQTMGQHLRSQDAPAVRRFGRAMFLCAWNAATEAAPITDAEQAAWHAGIDEGRSQVRAPLQQGEYPEPQQDSDDDPASLGAYLAAWAGGVHSRTKNDTGAAEEWISVSVERLGHAAAALIAARGAAQAAPALPAGWVPLTITHEGDQPEEVAFGPQIMMDRLKKWLDRYFAMLAAPAVEQVGLVGVRPNGDHVNLGKVAMPPRMKARELATEQFGHFTDDDGSDAELCFYALEQFLAWLIGQGWGPAPVAEDADPLQGAANWLVASHTITSATTLGGRLCIGYNRAERLFNAARAQAAQPEGGA